MSSARRRLSTAQAAELACSVRGDALKSNREIVGTRELRLHRQALLSPFLTMLRMMSPTKEKPMDSRNFEMKCTIYDKM